MRPLHQSVLQRLGWCKRPPGIAGKPWRCAGAERGRRRAAVLRQALTQLVDRTSLGAGNVGAHGRSAGDDVGAAAGEDLEGWHVERGASPGAQQQARQGRERRGRVEQVVVDDADARQAIGGIHLVQPVQAAQLGVAEDEDLFGAASTRGERGEVGEGGIVDLQGAGGLLEGAEGGQRGEAGRVGGSPRELGDEQTPRDVGEVRQQRDRQVDGDGRRLQGTRRIAAGGEPVHFEGQAPWYPHTRGEPLLEGLCS